MTSFDPKCRRPTKECGNVCSVSGCPKWKPIYLSILKQTMLRPLVTPVMSVPSLVGREMPWELTNTESITPKIELIIWAIFVYSVGVQLYSDESGQALYSCSVCEYTANTRQRIEYHYDAKHSSNTYQCSLCEKICPTKNALLVHKSRYHKK